MPLWNGHAEHQRDADGQRNGYLKGCLLYTSHVGQRNAGIGGKVAGDGSVLHHGHIQGGQLVGFGRAPVSYTHLDVYKRQTLHWAMTALPGATMAGHFCITAVPAPTQPICRISSTPVSYTHLAISAYFVLFVSCVARNDSYYTRYGRIVKHYF